MLPARPLIIAGGVAFAGAALGWMLPPTTPHGGPTVAELARSGSSTSDLTIPVSDSSDFSRVPAQAEEKPAPAIYAPAGPGLSLIERRSRPGATFRQDEGDWQSAAADDDDGRRAFRRGYRHAARAGIADPNACERLADWAEADGCLAYVNEAEQSDEADDAYDQ